MNNLDTNSLLIIAGILITLYFLKLILNNQQRILNKLSSPLLSAPNTNSSMAVSAKPPAIINKSGKANGNVKLYGDFDDETVAVIMAAVSHASNTSLNSLKFKSIKKISE